METKRRVSWRILAVSMSLIVLFCGLTVRLWWIQSVDAPWILEKAEAQWERSRDLPAKRGAILDRNGQVLAYEAKAYTVNAILPPVTDKEKRQVQDNYVKDPYDTARKLAPILGVPAEELIPKLTRDPGESMYVELGAKGRKKISEEQAKQIEALQYPKGADGTPSEKNQLPGIFLTETTSRYYPHNAFASHVLGYVSLDGQAMAGIEKEMDEQLRGKPGYIEMVRDRKGYQLPDGERAYKPPQDGLNVVLTIDQQIQDYVERELDRTQQEYKPKKMTVIVTDPNTGEILAMANRPTFNPNAYWDINGYDDLRNAAISDVFEPGSTFKIITLAAAIEEGKFNPAETYLSGVYRNVPGSPIRDHNGGQGWGRITFLEGVQRSSNVAFVILGYERLKRELLSLYFNKFGIGQKTGIDLPAEETGLMRDLKTARPRDVAVTTFGQGIAVTAIQQAAAVGAIANGGEWMRPYVVKELRDPRTGQVVQRNEPQAVRRVVSEKTAATVRDVLETVVTAKAGTGRAFYLDGYHVAGKTGTAQKYDQKTGQIMPGHYVFSFIGFAPKDHPRLLVYVVVDDPETDMPSSMVGSKVVAPIFKNVMEKSLKYLQQKPDLTQAPAQPQTAADAAEAADAEAAPMPKLVGMTASTARQKAQEEGLSVTVVGTGTRIAQQFPAPYEHVLPGSDVILVTDRLAGARMPDFTGKSLREVMEFASLLDMTVTSEGSGFVTEQSIPPGSPIPSRARLHVKLASAAAP